MRKTKAVLGVIAAISFLAAAGFFSGLLAFDAQTSDGNMVRVDVKPVQLSAGKPTIFEIRLNTHSVNLGYDLVEAGLLQDSQGKTYKPERWKGSPPGGHHRSGVLEFPQLEGNPGSVTFILKNIAGVPERSFQWKMGS